jgi:hypothetical protein
MSKATAASKLLSKVTENTPKLQELMFSTLEELLKSKEMASAKPVKEQLGYLTPGRQLVKDVDGKQAKFTLTGEELELAKINELLGQTDLPEKMSGQQILDMIQPYDNFKFGNNTGGQYDDYNNFDEVISATGGGNNFSLNDLHQAIIREGNGQPNPLLRRAEEAYDTLRDLREELLSNDDVEEYRAFAADRGIEGSQEDYISEQLNRQFGTDFMDYIQNARSNTGAYQTGQLVDTEALYDVISSVKDASAKALPVNLTMDTRNVPDDLQNSTKEAEKYINIQGNHYGNKVMSHSRTYDKPVLSDRDRIVSEVQSDMWPAIATAMKLYPNIKGKKMADVEAISESMATKFIDNYIELTGKTPTNQMYDDARQAGLNYLKTPRQLAFLSENPFKENFPRVEMNRILADALSADEVPGHLIYNDAASVNSSAPKAMYERAIPEQFTRLSRAYGIPLTDVKKALGSESTVSQNKFSGALPLKENADFMRKVGVPFLGMSPLMLLQMQDQDQ